MRIYMQTQIKNQTFETAFKEFISAKEAINLSEASIKDYTVAAELFLEFYGENKLASRITDKTITDYLAYLRKRPNKKMENELLGERTIATYINNLRVILYFFMEKGYMERFPITLPKADKIVRSTYTQDEIEKLLVKPNVKTCNFSEYRNWVIINYLLGTANRISTVVNLKIRDLDFEAEEIVLRIVKNKKPYIIPMDKRLKKILIEYLTYRKGEPDDYLFCNEKTGKQLSVSGLQTAIFIYNKRRGVNRTACHVFRNYFAKHYLLNRWRTNELKINFRA